MIAPEGTPQARGPWLVPLAALFGGVAALRAALYARGLLPRARLAGPVISVGNLSVGGSGKTPVVAWIAETLRDAGLPVAVLSRGYRGRFSGAALVVGDGREVLADAALAGDEPAMLARALPGVVVAVGRRRDRVGRAVERAFGPRVHVLDDGFQHLRLARDLDIVCIGARDAEDRPLPAGRLREFPTAAARADLVLITHAGDVPPATLAALVERFGPRRTFPVRRRPLGFFGLDAAPAPPPARPFLLSGIARPERFEADVRAASGSCAGHRRFPDHHPFSAGELREALAEARAAGADAVVTTAKDAVRLPGAPGAPPILVFRIAAAIEGEGELRERLLAVARRAA